MGNARLCTVVRRRGVRHLLTIPLQQRAHVVNFLNISGPERRSRSPALLSSVRFFIAGDLRRGGIRRGLCHLDCQSALAKLSGHGQCVRLLRTKGRGTLGRINNVCVSLGNLGHYGSYFNRTTNSTLVYHTTSTLGSIFPNRTYHVNKSRFIIVYYPIARRAFRRRIRTLQTTLIHRRISTTVNSF